ncbi:MAG: flagellar brake protein [Chthonomonas sp.]|nr:flagellar brake protein [Chthonomonas sp.]
MESILQTLQFFALSFVLAMAFGYVVTQYRLRGRRHFLEGIAPEAVVRVKSECGVYRARFIGWREGHLEVSAPLQRSHFVPLRVGQELIIEAPVQDKVVLFHTEVISRDPRRHSFILEKPEAPSVVNRRESNRIVRYAGTEALLNEEPAELVDVSIRGGKFLSKGTFNAGDVVRVRIPELGANVLGWIIDCIPVAYDEGQGTCTRIRFADDLPPIPAHTSPATS